MDDGFFCGPPSCVLGELNVLILGGTTEDSKLSEHFQTAKKVATLIARKAIPVAGKIATAGILDLGSITEEAISEYVSGSLTDAVDAYTAQRALISKFRSSLETSINDLVKDSDKDKIVFFVDELDRCRPSYAVDLLERIKHLFDIENVIFILSLDKTQLGISLGAVYGEKIDSAEYLRRFIDLEFRLPKPDAKKFTRHLYDSFGFGDIFSERKQQVFQYDSQHLVDTFQPLSELLNLSLRAREQCFTTIRVALMLTPNNRHIYSHLLTTLAILRVGAPEIYQPYALENGKATDVIDFLRQKSGGQEKLAKDFGAVTEAYLLAARSGRFGGDNEEFAMHKEAAANETLSEAERERAGKIIRIANDMIMKDQIPNLSNVVNKLELASRFES